MPRPNRTGPSRCTTCLREKDVAIREQVELGCICDSHNCVFSQEIIDAIANNAIAKYCINCGHLFDVGDLYCTECGCKR